MSRFHDRLQKLTGNYERQLRFKRDPCPSDCTVTEQTSDFRQFALQPIVGPKEQRYGSEIVIRNEASDAEVGILIDNLLLYGFEEPVDGRPVFLRCPRETLASDVLSLLPNWAVIEIAGSVKPDKELLLACRALKAAGYRFALGDFESLRETEAFLELADFIKVDFRHPGHRERACMLRDLNLTRAVLIADKIESEEEFHKAVGDGFGLFQGYWAGETVRYAKREHPLDPMKCTCIFGALEEPLFSTDGLVELVNLEPGIERRLLRRANWATPRNRVIQSTRDALEVVGKAGLQKIVTLAMMTESEEDMRPRSVPQQRTASSDYGADALVRWMEAGARTPWWYDADPGTIS